MNYTQSPLPAGLVSYQVSLAPAERRRIDATFTAIRCMSATKQFNLYLDGVRFSFDKGIGISFKADGERGQPFLQRFEIENVDALQVDLEIVVGVGDIQDSRLNFVAGVSSLHVIVDEDKVRKSIRPLNVGASGGVDIAAGATAALVAADDWRGEVSIGNDGTVPFRVVASAGSTRGPIVWPGDVLVIKAAHALWVVNMSSDFSAYASFLTSAETVIP